MIGPEHYAAAEDALDTAEALCVMAADAGRDLTEDEADAVDYHLQLAARHAQLAQVAATVEAGWPGLEHGPADRWAVVLSPSPVSAKG
jgi:hypothetical protein